MGVGVNATSFRRDERQVRLGRASGKHWPQHPRRERQQRRGGDKVIGEAGIEPQPRRTVGKAREPSSPPPPHPPPRRSCYLAAIEPPPSAEDPTCKPATAETEGMGGLDADIHFAAVFAALLYTGIARSRPAAAYFVPSL